MTANANVADLLKCAPPVSAELRAIDRAMATKSLLAFIRQAWPTVEPAKPYIDNWHIQAIAEHLEAVTRGEIRKLLINIPPGHAKSLLVGVFWPAWVWIQPGGAQWRALFASYSSELSIRDSVRCRMLIESAWYRDLFEPAWTLLHDQNAKSRFTNTELGYRMATSVGGRGTGFRADCIVADDPMNVKDQYSPLAREKVVRWWDNTMSSRLNDKRHGAMVIIMQRLHEQDLSGHVLEQGGYEHLCMPTEFEPDRRATTCLGGDPRQDTNELLFPELFPRDVVDEIKREMGSATYAGQHQQRPSPEGGGILKRHWWRFWAPKGAKLSPISVRMPDGELQAVETVELPGSFDQVIQSWDCAFKDVRTADYVTGQVWGRSGARRFLLDQVRDRLDCPGTMQAIRNLTDRWPKAELKLVEDKANGPAVIQMLRREISGLVAVEPEGGKVSRAYAASPQIEAGNVYLPHPAYMPWVEPLIEECATFPNGAHDDQVDAMTQALHRLKQSTARIRSFNDPYDA